MSGSSRGIFVSYASQDEEAVKRLCDALRAAGLEIWFDHEALRGGDAWDASIRAKIKDCALFMPVISASTQARGEGYFRLEWKLAVDRSHLMAEDQPFLVPVVIDETPEAGARVPDAFRARQWIRLHGAGPTAGFVSRLRLLLDAEGDSGHEAESSPLARAVRAASGRKPSRWLWIAPLAVLLAALSAFLAQRSGNPGPVEARDALTRDFAPASAIAAPVSLSVAVLPFANLSDDKGNEYFSDGISEELLTVLQKIAGLQVAARSSSFSLKGTNASAQEIGRKLGVAHVVEGSVRRSGNSVRIAARLSRAATGEQLWSDAYTRDLKDVFAVQNELAGTIVEQLRGHLTGTVSPAARAEIRAQVETAARGGTRNTDAHQLYLKGLFDLHQYSMQTVVRAEGHLQRAVALDPKFALAWAALAQAGSRRAGYASSKRDFDEGWALARRSADRALEIEPNLASAHIGKLTMQIWHSFDWKGARESLRRAEAAAPGDAEVIAAGANLAFALGQKDAAVALAEQAVSRDPLNAESHANFGFILDSVGRHRDSEAQFRRVIEINPNAPLWGHAGIAYALMRQGRYDEALREAEKETNEWGRLMVQAQTYWALGKPAESDAALARLVAHFADVAAIQIAQAHAYRGDKDRAFEWLDRAADQRVPGVAWTKSDGIFARLNGDRRWAAYLRKVGLSDEQLK
jgi:TolB-like protein/Tfp pilus assembly protein PilF